MARSISSLYSLNRGLVSRYGLARVDVKRLALAAEVMTNWIPRVLGAMSLRPGLQYIGGIFNDLPCRFLKFIFSTTDTALLELTDSTMRVWINDVLLARPAVTTTVVNGSFTSDLTGWTDNDESGAVSSWALGTLQLVGSGTARAIRDQHVVTAQAGIEHALRVVIARGPVSMRVGNAIGDDSYVREAVLQTGTYSLAFTPTANDFYIRFFSSQAALVQVSDCNIEAAGIVTLPTPWTADDLSNVRYEQSADVVFVACPDFQQRRIERRGTGRSWGVGLYVASDGPFDVQNTSPVTLTPSGLTGNIVVSASAPTFRSDHVGALFSLTSIGQDVTKTATATGQFTTSIRVTGIENDRAFSVIIGANNNSSTVDLQRSYDNQTWASVGGAGTYTSNTTTGIADGLNNQIVYYRLFATNLVNPDNVTMELRIGSGSVRGIVRVTGFADSANVTAEVLTALGGTTANKVWQEGQWSDKNGWPTSVRLHDGRLWWSGKNGIWGSISDAYDSFDETFVGDAGPINRTIGSGPVDTINWLMSLQRLVCGAQGAEFSARASSLDEPLTPSNFGIKATTTQGSASVEPFKVDQMGYFVNRSGIKLFELAFSIQAYDYSANNTMEIVPELGSPGIVRLDGGRQPDTRIHCVRSDGTVCLLVMNKAEDVTAWVEIETDGFIEDVVTLPALSGTIDDQVYYVVRRTVNGELVRNLEKWSQEVECRGGSLNKQADSFLLYTGAPASLINGLNALEGRQVVVWADGADLGTYTVTSGQITLPKSVQNAVIGLPYTAQFKTAKLGDQANGSSLNQQKKGSHIGLVLADTHPQGLEFGPSFDYLDPMPEIEDGTLSGPDVRTAYDENLIEFPGTWTTDLRICLQAQAPRPCSVLAVTFDAEAYN